MEKMNKPDKACQIARDLMPLCLDDAASEGSRAYVNDHISACRECNAYYQGMKSRLPIKTDAERRAETEDFAKVRQRLINKRRRKGLIIALCSLVLVAVLSVTLFPTLYGSWYNAEADADLDDYDIRLSQLQDGRVIVSFIYTNENAYWSYGWYSQLRDGNYYFRKSVYRSRTQRDAVTNEPAAVLSADTMRTLNAIYKGKEKHCEEVWRKGEPIEPASEAMEGFYQLTDYINKIADPVRELFVLTSESYNDTNLSLCDTYHDILWAQCEYLATRVPEWQPYTGAHTPVAQSEELLNQCFDYFNSMFTSSLGDLLPVATGTEAPDETPIPEPAG